MTSPAILCVPADNRKYLDGCRSFGVPVMLDAEDGVRPENRHAALDNAVAFATRGDFVRAGREDIVETGALARLRESGATYVVPKCEGAVVVGCVALIETPLGVRRLDEIIRSGPSSVFFGWADLSATCRVLPTSRLVEHAECEVLFAAKAAGLRVIRGPSQYIERAAKCHEDALRARDLGYDGVGCVSPAQIKAVELAFRPGVERIEWARAILDAASDGAFSDGRIVAGPPLVKLAHWILS